jgi:Zn-finger protein
VKNSSRYFENRDCEYYPCHNGMEHINCLFCFCPFYHEDHCPGVPGYIETDGRRIKDCSGCVFPHLPENYNVMMRILS